MEFYFCAALKGNAPLSARQRSRVEAGGPLLRFRDIPVRAAVPQQPSSGHARRHSHDGVLRPGTAAALATIGGPRKLLMGAEPSFQVHLPLLQCG